MLRMELLAKGPHDATNDLDDAPHRIHHKEIRDGAVLQQTLNASAECREPVNPLNGPSKMLIRPLVTSHVVNLRYDA
jgi:hypothetical protein